MRADFFTEESTVFLLFVPTNLCKFFWPHHLSLSRTPPPPDLPCITTPQTRMPLVKKLENNEKSSYPASHLDHPRSTGALGGGY